MQKHLPLTPEAAMKAAQWGSRLRDPLELLHLSSWQWDSWVAEAKGNQKAAHERALVGARESYKQWVAEAVAEGGRKGHQFTRAEEYAPPIEAVEEDGVWMTTVPAVMDWRRRHWKGIWGSSAGGKQLGLYQDLCSAERKLREDTHSAKTRTETR